MNLHPFIEKIKKWRAKYTLIIFLCVFALLMILFYAFYLNPWLEKTLFTPLVNSYALLSGRVLSILGYTNTVSGDTIGSTWLSISIFKGCDAIEPMALFIAGILAFPASIRNKLLGLLVGLLCLYVLNLIRIVTLFLVGIYHYKYFETMHLTIWQVIYIILTIGLWFTWLYMSVLKTRKA